MNETLCDRCGEVPADTIVEHTEYGEAVCKTCLQDEEMWESERALEREYEFNMEDN